MKTHHNESICLFQDKVSELLLRHHSILDSISKLVESAVRVNRAITKAVTDCGCVSINAHNQQIPPDITLESYKKYLTTHLEGTLCENCREIIEEEIGNQLFYLAAVCNILGFKLENIVDCEHERLNALGIFRLS